MALETALVTGASGGIGRELARLLAARRHPLVVVARSGDDLRQLALELAPLSVEVIEMDLAGPGAAQRLYDEVRARGLRVELLVNNAGFGHNGAFLDTDLSVLNQMMELNMVTLTELCHLFGRDMAASGRGQILNVASTAAFQPGPWMAVYYASKAYVLSLSEALHEELKGQGVTVTALCPGPTRTGFQERAHLDSRLKRLSMMEAAPVAAAGYRALQARQPVTIPGWLNATLAFSTRLMPRAWTARLSGFLAKKEP